MTSKRRRGRPRKSGHRYKNGNLRASSDPAISPTQVAATQPHRQGLGDHAADQKAESYLGRMALRGQITQLQYLAGQTYGRQWRTYLATLDGPRWTGRGGSGRVSACDGCPTSGDVTKCACGLAARLWRRSWDALSRVGAAVLVTDTVAYEAPVAAIDRPLLCAGLDELVWELGLTPRCKSDFVKNLNPNHV